MMEIGILALAFAGISAVIAMIGASVPQEPPKRKEKVVRYPYPREL